LERGRFEDVELRLDDAGYRFLSGHRIRLALSTTYFPMVLPPPTAACLTLVLGANAYLDVPTPVDLADIEMPEPPDGLLPEYPRLTEGTSSRTIDRDGDRVVVTVRQDGGEIVHPTNGMVWREVHESVSSITADDPLSVDCLETLSVMRRRSGVETRSIATGRLRATADAWRIDATITAWENDRLVFDREWHRDIPRDLQ
jgi:hypothetical protein